MGAVLTYLGIDSFFWRKFPSFRVSFFFWGVCVGLACWGSLGGLDTRGVGSTEKLEAPSVCQVRASFLEGVAIEPHVSSVFPPPPAPGVHIYDLSAAGGCPQRGSSHILQAGRGPAASALDREEGWVGKSQHPSLILWLLPPSLDVPDGPQSRHSV